MALLWPFRSSGAKAFSVHEPPENTGPPSARAERLVFIPDGFSWRAALFGPIYLALKREWVGLLIYAAAAVTVVNVLRFSGAEPQWISWALVLLNVITGFEAADVRRSSLVRAGWRDLGSVSGASAEDAERRFFEAWLPAASASAVALPASVEQAPAQPAHPAAIPHHDAVSRATPLLHRLSARFSGKSATGT